MTKAVEQLTAILARFVDFSGKYLPDDVLVRLRELRAEEDSPMGTRIYDAMFRDLDLAAELNRPCCQDTGVIQFFVQAGTAFPCLGELETALREAVIRATAAAPLRPNVVECFDEKNTGNNTGTRIPWIDWELVPNSSGIRVFVYMAGGGCSLPGFARVFMPLEGYEGAVKAVFDQVVSYGINACPPLLIGIGLGASADAAAKLSKKALLRFIGSRNSGGAAELETRLEKGLNALGIGPGGFSGKHSVMAVHVEHSGRHTATLALGFSTGCWAHRRALIEITGDLRSTLLSHRRASLDGVWERFSPDYPAANPSGSSHAAGKGKP
ncbi:MAG: L(+)-tartrate dehydratase subunit alpha [Spirochaetaceae bacterium]|jgi:L(+)-tartrate dehydratase alpha subunit|nr:L(+)-tartrate dehydratase subunit alpha [Spirochaetaceae bacterium]